MQANRRSFLGLFASAPFAAKAAAESSMASIDGNSAVKGVLRGHGLRGHTGGPIIEDGSSEMDPQSAKPLLKGDKLARFYQRVGVPAWLRADWHREAEYATRHAGDLFPEVTCLRSVNHQTRRALQIRLTVAREERRFFAGIRGEGNRDAWYDWMRRFKGFRVPWI